jgi:hypothetical protein
MVASPVVYIKVRNHGCKGPDSQNMPPQTPPTILEAGDRPSWPVPPQLDLGLDKFVYMCKLHISMGYEREGLMETTKRANRTAERLAKASGDSYKMVVDHMVALQERNTKFAREMFDGTVREIGHQAESNRALSRELVERAEHQRDAFQALVGEAVDAYSDLTYAPLAYYRQGLRLVESEVAGSGFPISGYDEMNVREIRDRLNGLSAAEIRTVREYEKNNKNRETLIEQLDRKIRTASA